MTSTVVLADQGDGGIAPLTPVNGLMLSQARRLLPRLKRLRERHQLVEPANGHKKTEMG